MKSKDVALIGVMVFIGAIVALIVSHLIFATPKSRQQTAELVDPITSEFNQPPAAYFNPHASNPAPEIQIGNANNPTPFNSKSP